MQSYVLIAAAETWITIPAPRAMEFYAKDEKSDSPRSPLMGWTELRLSYRRGCRSHPIRDRLVAKPIAKSIFQNLADAPHAHSPPPSRSFPRQPKEGPSAGRAPGPTPSSQGRINLGIRGRLILGTRGRHHFGIVGRHTSEFAANDPKQAIL
jgi:hypothetical protein